MDDRFSETHLLATELTLTEQRALVFQLLYTMYAFNYEMSLEDIADNYYRGFDVEIPRDSTVFIMVNGIIEDRTELDEKIIPLLKNWRLDRLGVPTTLILRLAAWEIINTATDSAVILNEAVELAKCFAEKDSYKFINGVLDGFVKSSL